MAFAQGDLHSSELERLHDHLDACTDCQRLVSEAMQALKLKTADEPEAEVGSTTFQPNAVVNHRYRIHRFVSRGGMGEVYEAYDCDLRERVALKTVIASSSDASSAVRQLKAEVQLARRVSHPNVCRIYDFGSHQLEQSGTVISFLTMEFVDGESLGKRVRREGALPVLEAQQLACQLLAGLAAAHRAGVLHRDFKSENVLLRREGSDYRALISDFGLARALDKQGVGRGSSEHVLAGTLSYMAPEQIEGKPLSVASDLYSFAVVWFEMLTGELPFGRASRTQGALDRLHKAPVAPSRIRPEISRATDALVLRCLSRRPEERFQSADEVLEAIHELRPPTRRVLHRWLASTATLGLAVSAYLALAANGGSQGFALQVPALLVTPTATTRSTPEPPAPSVMVQPVRPLDTTFPPPSPATAGARDSCTSAPESVPPSRRTENGEPHRNRSRARLAAPPPAGGQSARTESPKPELEPSAATDEQVAPKAAADFAEAPSQPANESSRRKIRWVPLPWVRQPESGSEGR